MLRRGGVALAARALSHTRRVGATAAPQAAAQTGLASTAEALPPSSSGLCVRAVLDQELSECPAVLLRGLPGLTTPADFSEFMKGLGYRPKSYSGGSSSRGKVEQDVYTAADDPPAVSMGLHNEVRRGASPSRLGRCQLSPSIAFLTSG